MLSAGDAHYLLSCWQHDQEEEADIYGRELSSISPAESVLDEAIDAIDALRSADSYKRLRNLASFDCEAAVLLHYKVQELPPAIESNTEFWYWLAIFKFFEIIEWRHARKDEGAHPNNYGLGSRMGNYPLRLWLRASLSYDENAGDPYALTRKGTIDFWESGILRPRYSSCRALVKSFIRYQYPDNAPRGYLHPTDPQGVRMLYKRIKRMHTTLALELLDENETYELLEDLGADLMRA